MDFTPTLTLTHTILLLFAAFVGLYTCYIFYLEDHGKGPNCTNGACSIVHNSRWAKIFIIPNWYFGTAFYVGMLGVSLLNIPILTGLAALGSLGSLFMSCVLIWALIVKLQYFCKYCYIAHASNAVIFAILLASFLG